MTPHLSRPPDPTEIEVSVFGPGYGEAILVHYGDGKWIAVDSCLDPLTGAPAALSYLSDLGVDPGSAVSLVVVTHWHDDRVRGLAKLVAECRSAEFVMSMAFSSTQFLELANTFGRSPNSFGGGVTELSRVLDILKERQKSNPITAQARYAIADRLICRPTISLNGVEVPVTVSTLSPGDADQQAASVQFAMLAQEGRLFGNRLPTPDRNLASVALWIRAGVIEILLGGDLEECGDQNRGWSNVLRTKIERSRASIFKVAHHGSHTGYSSSVWTDLLIRRYAVASE